MSNTRTPSIILGLLYLIMPLWTVLTLTGTFIVAVLVWILVLVRHFTKTV